jgi:hypothetical protein
MGLIKNQRAKKLNMSRGMHKTSLMQRAGAAQERAVSTRYLAVVGKHPLGVRYMKYTSPERIHIKRISYRPAHFKKHIAPGGAFKRTSWGIGRKPHFKSHLFRRPKHFKVISKWQTRGKRWTPK